MKNLVVRIFVVACVMAGVAVVARLVGPKMGEAMERKFDDMPDDSPPKWMFLNITAIRENTDRLIELAEEQRAAQPESAQVGT